MDNALLGVPGAPGPPGAAPAGGPHRAVALGASIGGFPSKVPGDGAAPGFAVVSLNTRNMGDQTSTSAPDS